MSRRAAGGSWDHPSSWILAFKAATQTVLGGVQFCLLYWNLLGVTCLSCHWVGTVTAPAFRGVLNPAMTFRVIALV